jgi:antibiotic biosynthesis monooxygenase (ABM) superfamily enzyme
MLFKKYDFYDENVLFYTNLLSGEIGSGKTSFVMKYLYSLITPKRDKKGNIDHSFQMPFKKVFINVDGFAFESFNSFAKQNGFDVEFKWLDMQHFKDFAYKERELYTQFNSDGQGTIAKRVEEHMDDKYNMYFNALIVCDEADHWLTKKDDLLANFLKFKRHYGMEVWFLTQKFQNLHTSFYLSGAVNRFLRIRSSIFNLGKSRYIQHWANSDTSKRENLVETYAFTVEKEIYDLYDSGAILANSNKALTGSIFKPLMFLGLSIPFGIYMAYSLYSKHSSNENDNTSKTLIQKVSEPIKTVTNEIPAATPKHIVKCVSFGNTSNCYFDASMTSIPTKYIFKLAKSKITTVKTIFSYRDITYIALDDGALQLLFGRVFKFNKKDKND